jgi:hypothetical protein
MGPLMNASSSRSRHRLLLLPCILLPVLGCREGPARTDGETHFLRTCNPEGNGCSPGLACLCGVCSAPCANTTDCRELSRYAHCVRVVNRPAAAACADTAAPAFCDVRCTSNEDCSVLSSSYLCSNGFCRESSDVGAGAAADAGGAAGGTAAAACPSGQVPGNAVLVLGDAFIAQDHQITAYLENLAREAGALAAGERYRDYSSLAGNSLALDTPSIADQYATGQAEGPVQVVIMDGGGADVLLGSCDDPPAPDCEIMVNAVAAADELLAQMAQDAIEHVIWFFYPDPSDAELRAKVDVLRPLLQDACESSAAPCHWLDLQPTFAEHESEYLFTATAAAIWSTMQAYCIAQ